MRQLLPLIIIIAMLATATKTIEQNGCDKTTTMVMITTMTPTTTTTTATATTTAKTTMLFDIWRNECDYSDILAEQQPVGR